jgi:hypothetical protein
VAQIIRLSTAITVAIGPFLDSVDGVTAKTALSITQPDIRLSKNGAAFAQKSAAGTATHMENGYYSVSLSTTDTATVGRLTLHVNKATALPVFYEFQVVTAAVYDGLLASASTGALPVSSGGIASTAFASGAITATAIATDAIAAAKIAGNAITSAKIASDAIGATQIAADAITAAKVATDTVGAAQLATDAVTGHRRRRRVGLQHAGSRRRGLGCRRLLQRRSGRRAGGCRVGRARGRTHQTDHRLHELHQPDHG